MLISANRKRSGGLGGNFAALRGETLNIVLVGNPNSGKSSLFNALTGLNQKVGNFPGVTVDKKSGSFSLNDSLRAGITDLPGTYSLYPRRVDEYISYKVLMGCDATVKPDLVLLVMDAANLKRNLLFCTQILDLKLPTVVALTMTDLAKRKGTRVDVPGMEIELGVPIVPINPRKGKGISDLKRTIAQLAASDKPLPQRDFIDPAAVNTPAIDALRQELPEVAPYKLLHRLINANELDLPAHESETIAAARNRWEFHPAKTQADEIISRYARIRQIMQQTVVESDPLQSTLRTEKLDNILLHRTWGYVILLAVLFLLFQSVFWLAQFPMDGIEWSFGKAGAWFSENLPVGWFSDLFVNGILAGLSGIFVFVPQIMILFGLITLLEDTGYMARISFLTDKLMRKVGLNGKSVMPMISGYACAVPAIMSARNIENKKERLLTIMVTPLMSCSARLPVYTILISLIIPNKVYLGFISLPGMVMMALYLLGTVLALIAAWVMKWFIKTKERSFFILELPVYHEPRWKNVAATMLQKARIFVFDAGKVIMFISLLLWGLSSYGPPEKMNAVRTAFDKKIEAASSPAAASLLENEKQTAMLQASYAGTAGSWIEPAIRPLGYDWKIGVALITSFAAREVFVGTMATLYSVGGDADENSTTLRQKMSAAKRADGSKVYDLATGLSLLVFYVIAMQCMSTVVIVRKETGSWKWAVIQFLYMGALAYLLSFVVYQLFK